MQALIAHLHISQWSASKLDRVVTAHVTKEYQAKAGAGSWKKNLFVPDQGGAPKRRSRNATSEDTRNSYSKLKSYLAKLRDETDDLTNPYRDGGDRLLPAANQQRYFDIVEAGIPMVYDVLLPAFIRDYPDLIEAARQNSLGNTFNLSDYPPAAEVREKFGVSVEYDPLPSTSFAGQGLSPEVQRRMEREAEERATQRLEAGMDDAFMRLYKVVNNMHEALSNPKATFKNTLFGNVQQVTDLLQNLNVTNNPRLEQLRREAQEKLLQYQPDRMAERVRNSSRTRNQVAGHAAEILEALRGSRTIFQKPVVATTSAKASAAA
jgi:hypothetical protein